MDADSKYTDEIQGPLASIRIPTLILWGEEDSWIPLDKGLQLHERIPGSTLKTIPRSGHLVIEEQPEALLREIKTFLSG